MKIPTQLAFYVWRPAAWLRVGGADAESFLQGQFTNDLRNPPPRSAVYGLWLNVKGRVLADSFVLRAAAANEFWVGSYFSPAAAIRERLESFVIADDVVIEDATGNWGGVTLMGEGARSFAANLQGDGLLFSGRRGGGENVEWVFPATQLPALRAQLAGGREVSGEEMTRRRIAAGIAAVPVDIGPGDLPNEGGLDADAISFTKGCYLGQEVMARLKSMGQVRRRVLRVAGAGDAIPALPAPLWVGARQVGELRSAVRDGAGGLVGLAMLSLLHLKPDGRLALSPDGEPTMRVVDSP